MTAKPCAEFDDSQVPAKRLRRSRGETSCRNQPRDTFQVVIHCANEAEQERLYEEFRARNLQVRLLTM